MDHQQVTQLMVVEKYLLGELTPTARDEFEEHVFDCQECATDLRAAAEFIDSAKREFKAGLVTSAVATEGKSRLVSLWPSALVWSALAASLLVIAYQNVIVYPRFKTEIAAFRAPEILPSISLVGGNSRGGHIPTALVGAGQPFLLLVDIPGEDRFSSYTCLLYSPSGAVSWRIDVSAQAARDTISIRVPSIHRPSGEYTLTVQGNTDRTAAGSAVELAHYPFTLNSHS